jgi:hypothetical protein
MGDIEKFSGTETESDLSMLQWTLQFQPATEALREMVGAEVDDYVWYFNRRRGTKLSDEVLAGVAAVLQSYVDGSLPFSVLVEELQAVGLEGHDARAIKSDVQTWGSIGRVQEVVRHCDDAPSKWCVYSKKGKRLGGPYETQGEANERLGQIEFFKRQARRPIHGAARPVPAREVTTHRLIGPAQFITEFVQTYTLSPGMAAEYSDEFPEGRLHKYAVWGDIGRGKPEVAETSDDLNYLQQKYGPGLPVQQIGAARPAKRYQPGAQRILEGISPTTVQIISGMATDNFQRRTGYPRSNVPDYIEYWVEAGGQHWVTFGFKNTSEQTATAWARTYLQSQIGNDATLGSYNARQTGDYHDDWVEVDVVFNEARRARESQVVRPSDPHFWSMLDAWHGQGRAIRVVYGIDVDTVTSHWTPYPDDPGEGHLDVQFEDGTPGSIPVSQIIQVVLVESPLRLRADYQTYMYDQRLALTQATGVTLDGAPATISNAHNAYAGRVCPQGGGRCFDFAWVTIDRVVNQEGGRFRAARRRGHEAMTMQDRDRLRAKQDELIALAERAGYHEDLQISTEWPGSPTIRELRQILYPEFEDAINYAISYLKQQLGESAARRRRRETISSDDYTHLTDTSDKELVHQFEPVTDDAGQYPPKDAEPQPEDATMCICSACGARLEREPDATPCEELKCPKCGTQMVGETQDQVTALRAAQTGYEWGQQMYQPRWYQPFLDWLQRKGLDPTQAREESEWRQLDIQFMADTAGGPEFAGFHQWVTSPGFPGQASARRLQTIHAEEEQVGHRHICHGCGTIAYTAYDRPGGPGRPPKGWGRFIQRGQFQFLYCDLCIEDGTAKGRRMSPFKYYRNPYGRYKEADVEKSKGHLEFIGKFEYFIGPNGDLYRAPTDVGYIQPTGYKSGGRRVAPAHMVNDVLAQHRAQFWSLGIAARRTRAAEYVPKPPDIVYIRRGAYDGLMGRVTRVQGDLVYVEIPSMDVEKMYHAEDLEYRGGPHPGWEARRAREAYGGMTGYYRGCKIEIEPYLNGYRAAIHTGQLVTLIDNFTWAQAVGEIPDQEAFLTEDIAFDRAKEVMDLQNIQGTLVASHHRSQRASWHVHEKRGPHGGSEFSVWYEEAGFPYDRREFLPGDEDSALVYIEQLRAGGHLMATHDSTPADYAALQEQQEFWAFASNRRRRQMASTDDLAEKVKWALSGKSREWWRFDEIAMLTHASHPELQQVLKDMEQRGEIELGASQGAPYRYRLIAARLSRERLAPSGQMSAAHWAGTLQNVPNLDTQNAFLIDWVFDHLGMDPHQDVKEESFWQEQFAEFSRKRLASRRGSRLVAQRRESEGLISLGEFLEMGYLSEKNARHFRDWVWRTKRKVHQTLDDWLVLWEQWDSGVEARGRRTRLSASEQVDPGVGYRLLTPGERLQQGDEAFTWVDPDATRKGWVRVERSDVGGSAGEAYDPTSMVPIRRSLRAGASRGTAPRRTRESQMSFSPIRYLVWTDDWYTFDYEAAHRQARQDRDSKARELQAQGYKVRKWSMPNQRMSAGGIGTPHPHIELICTAYMLDYEMRAARQPIRSSTHRRAMEQVRNPYYYIMEETSPNGRYSHVAKLENQGQLWPSKWGNSFEELIRYCEGEVAAGKASGFEVVKEATPRSIHASAFPRSVPLAMDKVVGIDMHDFAWKFRTGRLAKDYEIMLLIGGHTLSEAIGMVNQYMSQDRYLADIGEAELRQKGYLDDGDVAKAREIEVLMTKPLIGEAHCARTAGPVRTQEAGETKYKCPHCGFEDYFNPAGGVQVRYCPQCEKVIDPKKHWIPGTGYRAQDAAFVRTREATNAEIEAWMRKAADEALVQSGFINAQGLALAARHVYGVDPASEQGRWVEQLATTIADEKKAGWKGWMTARRPAREATNAEVEAWMRNTAQQAYNLTGQLSIAGLGFQDAHGLAVAARMTFGIDPGSAQGQWIDEMALIVIEDVTGGWGGLASTRRIQRGDLVLVRTPGRWGWRKARVTGVVSSRTGSTYYAVRTMSGGKVQAVKANAVRPYVPLREQMQRLGKGNWQAEVFPDPTTGWRFKIWSVYGPEWEPDFVTGLSGQAQNIAQALLDKAWEYDQLGTLSPGTILTWLQREDLRALAGSVRVRETVTWDRDVAHRGWHGRSEGFTSEVWYLEEPPGSGNWVLKGRDGPGDAWENAGEYTSEGQARAAGVTWLLGFQASRRTREGKIAVRDYFAQYAGQVHNYRAKYGPEPDWVITSVEYDGGDSYWLQYANDQGEVVPGYLEIETLFEVRRPRRRTRERLPDDIFADMEPEGPFDVAGEVDRLILQYGLSLEPTPRTDLGDILDAWLSGTIGAQIARQKVRDLAQRHMVNLDSLIQQIASVRTRDAKRGRASRVLHEYGPYEPIALWQFASRDPSSSIHMIDYDEFERWLGGEADFKRTDADWYALYDAFQDGAPSPAAVSARETSVTFGKGIIKYVVPALTVLHVTDTSTGQSMELNRTAWFTIGEAEDFARGESMKYPPPQRFLVFNEGANLQSIWQAGQKLSLFTAASTHRSLEYMANIPPGWYDRSYGLIEKPAFVGDPGGRIEMIEASPEQWRAWVVIGPGEERLVGRNFASANEAIQAVQAEIGMAEPVRAALGGFDWRETAPGSGRWVAHYKGWIATVSPDGADWVCELAMEQTPNRVDYGHDGFMNPGSAKLWAEAEMQHVLGGRPIRRVGGYAIVQGGGDRPVAVRRVEAFLSFKRTAPDEWLAVHQGLKYIVYSALRKAGTWGVEILNAAGDIVDQIKGLDSQPAAVGWAESKAMGILAARQAAQSRLTRSRARVNR